MVKKIFAGTLAVVIIVSMLSLAVTAAPFKEIRIGEGETVIEAVWFDSGEENYESNGDGNTDIREDEFVATYDYTINGDYAGGRETDTPSCIGWIGAGDWVQYTVEVDVAGKYQVAVWLAVDGATGETAVSYNGTEIGSTLCDAIGWHDYVLYPIGTVDMVEGTGVIRVDFLDGVNIESLVVTLLEAVAPPVVEEPAAEVELVAAPVVEAAPVVAAPAPIAAPSTGFTSFAVIGIIGAAVAFGKVRSKK